MNILKHGDLKRTNRLMRFECRACGCIWIAGPHEVYRNREGLENACYCPECHELTKEHACGDSDGR